MSDDHEHHGGEGKPSHYEKLDNHGGHGGHGGGAHAEEGEGPWLMSFADMVTLLMCFFILFFSTDKGSIKIENPEELLKKLNQIQKLLAMEQSESKRDQSASQRTASGAYGSIDVFKHDIKSISKELDLVFSVGTPQPGEIELTFLNTRFFKSGDTILTPAAYKMIEVVAKKLKAMDQDAEIVVEGHTDTDPIRSKSFPSNWELSGARAATVVRLFQEYGLNPSRLQASGLAHYRPIAPERDKDGRNIAENKALNRRIVIRVKTPLAESESGKDSGANGKGGAL
ncbi:flagellar motor protein MotD [Planctomyces bekefii]|uniref:Flagellar motor protein MotD n=1 Tax=Planctomyces bekefii TaxID=1653850 RepID=A0A5C6M977_9PLAN|nr:flagellar motor protein MotD [Planctomyces bekefii]